MRDCKIDNYSRTKIPRHLAIVMDGNGRWANQRFLPRLAGHKAGITAAQNVIKRALECRIEVLSLFVLSCENWRRPEYEVNYLLDLFLRMLQNEILKLSEQGIRLKIIGERKHFTQELLQHIEYAEQLTANNSRLSLILAVNYGGQWDLVQAMQHLGAKIASGALQPQDISAHILQQHLALGDLPSPDLLIRTSGEQRISNFFLWDLAYTELYFPETLWPDFDAAAFDRALQFFAGRQRRFGHTNEQLEQRSDLCLNSV